MTTPSAPDTSLARFLDLFPEWLRTLGQDAGVLGELVVAGNENDEVMRYLVSGLNYIFKSLDLIPDGIDDLGFCDDAFVIRVAASLALEVGATADGPIAKLAGEAKEVEGFLEAEDYAKLVTYVKGLRKGAARGRTVDDIMTDKAARASFVHEVAAWAKEYQVPSFTRDLKTLIKLKAFLNAKLS